MKIHSSILPGVANRHVQGASMGDRETVKAGIKQFS